MTALSDFTAESHRLYALQRQRRSRLNSDPWLQRLYAVFEALRPSYGHGMVGGLQVFTDLFGSYSPRRHRARRLVVTRINQLDGVSRGFINDGLARAAEIRKVEKAA